MASALADVARVGAGAGAGAEMDDSLARRRGGEEETCDKRGGCWREELEPARRPPETGLAAPLPWLRQPINTNSGIDLEKARRGETHQ
jgi:hypothetical protein